jgi:hypothetical protein
LQKSIAKKTKNSKVRKDAWPTLRNRSALCDTLKRASKDIMYKGATPMKLNNSTKADYQKR